MMIIKVMTL